MGWSLQGSTDEAAGGADLNPALLDHIVRGLLYKGCGPYPYQPSIKNSDERCTLGRVYPKAYSAFLSGAAPCLMQTECLQQRRGETASIEVSIRFLHLLAREVGVLLSGWKEASQRAEPSYSVVRELEIGGRVHRTWQEAVEREVKLSPVLIERGRSGSVIQPFQFPSSKSFEPLLDSAGKVVALIARRHEALEGVLELKVKPVADNYFKIVVHILNLTPLSVANLANPEAVMMRMFTSTHAILQAKDGEFVSLIDPPDELKQLAGDCRNIGTWPVLVGNEREAKPDTMLSSPVVLYDYPGIAAESGGKDFDATGQPGRRFLDEIEPLKEALT